MSLLGKVARAKPTRNNGLRAFLLALTAMASAACGGGDPDQDDTRAGIPADPRCVERPELCQ